MTVLLHILSVAAAVLPPDAILEEANAAYNNQAYLEAVRFYEQLISDGVHDPVVFYNLGNAYFNAGHLGQAIANYERALYLNPAFYRARSNLDYALSTAERPLAQPVPPWWEQTVLFWHARVSPHTATRLALGLWGLFWGLLCARRVRPFAYSRGLLALTGVLAVALGASAWAKSNPPALAVASRERVPVYYAMRPSDAIHFELFAGDRVRIEESHGAWLRIATADGRRGWTETDAMTIVGPPFAPSLAVREPDDADPAGGAG